MVVKGGDPHALAVALEAKKFTGRTRMIIISDQENAVKNIVDMIRNSRTPETVVINTPKGWSASAGGIERANYEVEKQIRTLRSRFEENYGESVGLDNKMLPSLSGAALCVEDNIIWRSQMERHHITTGNLWDWTTKCCHLCLVRRCAWRTTLSGEVRWKDII